MRLGDCLVVLPTYNEALNIRHLTETVLLTSPTFHVVVVDDSSPDGTAGIVKEITKRESRVTLIVRPKKLGLGSAYLAGFRAAQQRGFGSVCTMDADRSHDPTYIIEMLRTQREYDADIVIGSRYVPGGGIGGWSASRKLNSHFANALVRKVLRLSSNDCTSGFRLYSERILRRLNLASLKSTGYSMLVELLYDAQSRGARIIEVPIFFSNRTRGKSKLNSGEIITSLLTYGQLGLKKYLSEFLTDRQLKPRASHR